MIISTEQRKSIHLAAVFVNNFYPITMTGIGQKFVKKHKVSNSNFLKPLIQETAKINAIAPLESTNWTANAQDIQTHAVHLGIAFKTIKNL